MNGPAPQAWSSSARQTGVCDACGRGIVIEFAQVATAGNLRWSWSAPCSLCQKSPGHEGIGTTPAEIRAAILGAEGEWSVAIRTPEGVSIAAIKALRSVFGLGLKEAKDQWDASAAAAGLRGTRAECEALITHLRADGVESEAAFAGAASSSPAVVPPRPGGEWVVRIPYGPTVTILAIKWIRPAFGLGLKDAKDLWDRRGAAEEIRGTRAQCEALAAGLTAEKVAHSIGPA